MDVIELLLNGQPAKLPAARPPDHGWPDRR